MVFRISGLVGMFIVKVILMNMMIVRIKLNIGFVVIVVDCVYNGVLSIVLWVLLVLLIDVVFVLFLNLMYLFNGMVVIC